MIFFFLFGAGIAAVNSRKHHMIEIFMIIWNVYSNWNLLLKNTLITVFITPSRLGAQMSTSMFLQLQPLVIIILKSTAFMQFLITDLPVDPSPQKMVYWNSFYFIFLLDFILSLFSALYLKYLVEFEATNWMNFFQNLTDAEQITCVLFVHYEWWKTYVLISLESFKIFKE